MPIAAGIGWWCDRVFESQPIGLLIGVVLGFAAMLLRILRMRPGASEDPNQEEEPSDEPSKPEITAPGDPRDSQDPKP